PLAERRGFSRERGLHRVSHVGGSCQPMYEPPRSGAVGPARAPLRGATPRGRAVTDRPARGPTPLGTRTAKERSMRKGFFASVAALAASAGVACGQGSPG